MSEIEEEPAEGEAPVEEAKTRPRRLVLLLGAAGLLVVVAIVVVVALLVLRKPKPASEAGRHEAPAEFALPVESADQNAVRAAALAKAAAEGDLKAAPPVQSEPPAKP